MELPIVDRNPPPVPDGAAPALRFVERVRVPFRGDRGGTGPLTLGHLNIVQWIADARPHLRMMADALDLARGTRLDDVTAALGVLMASHESLRTTLSAMSATATTTQHVARSGEASVDVYRLEGPRRSEAELVDELIRRLRAREFDLTVELPVRVAVVVDGGMPVAGAVLYSHVVVDLESMALLHRQFTELIGEPDRRTVRRPAHQPLDQAAVEWSPRGRRRNEQALRYWERHLRQAPQCLYPVPPSFDGPGRPRSGWLWSRAAALALSAVAARTGAGGSTVVLAAVAAVLSHRTGIRDLVLPVLSSNRFARRLRDYVGPLAGDSLVALDGGARSFDALVRRAGTAMLRARAHPVLEPAGKSRMLAEVNHRRGICHARYCVFNDISALDTSTGGVPQPVGPQPVDPAELDRASAETTLWWDDCPDPHSLIEFQLLKQRDRVVLGACTSDRLRVPDREIESLLRGVEAVLVAAAAGDVELSRVGALTGIAPMRRGSDWYLVDSCWIQLSEVRRLVDDALPGARSGVFVVGPPGGPPVIVAYVAGGPARTAAQAHAACVAALPGRNTAMAPHRYVICDAAPPAPASRADWLGRTVRDCGDGR